MPITEADFDVVSRQEVRHRASGARFVSPIYVDIEDTGTTVTVSLGSAGDGDLPTADDLLPHAVRLLRKLAGASPL